LGTFSPIGLWFKQAVFMKMAEVARMVWLPFSTLKVIGLDKRGLGYIFGDIFTNSSGHPACMSNA
jgi:hypothetical protein